MKRVSKSLFNSGGIYNSSRPSYPRACFEYCESFSVQDAHLTVLDIGCGNGQACRGWVESPNVDHVIGIDPSQSQLDKAFQHRKVSYHRADATSMPMIDDATVDIVSVFTAAHWFTSDPLVHKEIKRVARPGALVFFISYAESFTGDADIDALCGEFQRGLPWAQCIQLNLNQYRDILFPYRAVDNATKSLDTSMRNNLEQRLAYFNSWSAVATSMANTGVNPVDSLRPKLEQLWGNPDTERTIQFPLHYRIGRV